MNLAFFFHDFTFIWNLKNKISKQSESRVTDTENTFMVVREERGQVKGVARLRSINIVMTVYGARQMLALSPLALFLTCSTCAGDISADN